MDRILKSFVDDFCKSQEILEKDESKKFELFSSYCAIAQQYTEEINVADLVTGDGNDCGIDAMAIIMNGNLVNSKDEVDDILELNKRISELTFMFVQAKTSPNFNYGEIGIFGAGVKDFISEKPMLKRNNSIEEKRQLVEYIFSNSIKIKKKPDCYLYYVTTGKWVDDENCLARIKQIETDLKDLFIFDEIKFIPVGANLLQKYYRNTIDVAEKEICFENKILLPNIQEVRQSYIGYIEHNEYINLISNEHGEINRSIFYDNVRDFQGIMV